MASAENTKPLNVAVIGGGIGGLCMAIGLLHHPHIRVQIYEAAHKFSEIGAGVSFGPNAQKALRLIGDSTEQAFLRQATHNMTKEMKNVFIEYRFGMGPRDGEIIAAPRNETGQSSVHRAKFLEEFVALIPKEIAHFGKRLDKLQEDKDGVKLHFKDGTTAEADCVIGCDGVHSVIRTHLLGEDHPAVNPKFSGSVAYRGLIPMKEAIEAVGERFAANSYNYCGNGGCVNTYPVDFGEIMNVVAINSTYDHWDGPWVQKAEYSKIEKEFSAWGPHVRKIVSLLDRPETAAWSMWDHPPAPTFYRGKIVMLGDAAHATTPFQGQGAGQAIEDAFVLESLFAKVDTPEKATMAFQAYDRIRRPRSQRVVQTSREAGELCALRLPNVMDSPEALKENIEWRMDWMWHRDIASERDEAMIIYNKLLAGEKLDYY
ncbi:MAG: hypothetical protein M1821_001780 [Bathelium mastoideum]|nr:MAG: hypothetical protein M1821_001780 [Bathelium mastoideum]KAI9691678.1 MAG: hypothetical protein M1822_007750 [Bathelium mastoideum]